MELSEWCEQVPHGQYFQAIRLHVDVPEASATAPPSSPPAASISPPTEPPVVPSTPPRDEFNGVSEANGVADSPGLGTPKRLKRRQKPPPTPPRTLRPVSDLDRDGTLLLPPFQSAHVGEDRMVLNVGGPVWAMDWLPHDVYRATVNGSKHKKHSAVNGENGTRVNGSAKDPLAEWRLLALSTHPPCTVVDDKLVKNTPPDHYYDAPQGGRSLVQIWAIPVTKPPPSRENTGSEAPHDQQSQPASRMIPRLVYAIDHDCGVAWDLQWAPLTHKMPRHRQSNGLLGVLAVVFGDGSLQIFEVPTISKDKLHAEPREVIVERLQPLGSGKVDRTIQLSARWSPHRWNLLLTGSSDGSVALWNLEELLSKPHTPDDGQEVRELEPQRRFQDADTIGKQETFDWGWGWVAVRAVCWSPFDENLFTTTGNDSLFKIWDIREPRICFRSHRIRSTWGLAIQWIDDTSIQISGDQGSLYMYDLLSGSYQKLHFHPQIDSPVWDLQFARRGQLPLLASSCTSGSLRLAPAKKLFRAPQHSVEICQLQGEKSSSVEQPHKNLRLSFEHRIVSGSAEAASPATREFCERDAALHRVRLSTHEPGEFPCFLSTGGHAGLVIIMEMQEELDHLFENYFMQPSKKIGRPRKTFEASGSPWNARKSSPDKEKKIIAPPKVKRVSGVKLSNFVQANAGMAGMKAMPKKTAQAAEFPEFEMESAASASASEAEYQEGDESESDSEELSLADDNSDDERVIDSDGDDESDEVAIVGSPQARMRQEYQLDLSEEDAILLAIQMSELEQTAPSPAPAPLPKPKAKTTVKATTPSTVASSSEKKAPAKAKAKAVKPKVVETPAVKPAVKPAAKPVVKPQPSPTPDRASPEEIYVEELDQASIQMMIYQQNMNEEEALREAIRMSEMGHMRRSHRKRKAPPTPPEAAASTPSSAQRTPKSQKRTTPPPEKKTETPAALSPDEVARRLEFASPAPLPPVASSATKQTIEVELAAAPSSRPPKPPVSSKKKNPPAKRADTSAEKPATATEQILSTSTESTAAVVSTSNQSAKKTQKSSSAAKSSATITPSSSAKKAPSSSAKKTPSSSAKKAKAKRSSNADMLTEEELLAIALQTSQIEY